jgi:hypothetical protein
MGLKGYRSWVMDQLDSTCRAPPRRLARAVAAHVTLTRSKSKSLETSKSRYFSFNGWVT